MLRHAVIVPVIAIFLYYFLPTFNGHSGPSLSASIPDANKPFVTLNSCSTTNGMCNLKNGVDSTESPNKSGVRTWMQICMTTVVGLLKTPMADVKQKLIGTQLLLRSSFQSIVRLLCFPFTFLKRQFFDPCKDVKCENNGVCKSGTCECAKGFTGDRCQTLIDRCKGIKCQNNGVCRCGKCSCVKGFTGDRCQTPPDPCKAIRCQNGGVCKDAICTCADGFIGDRCQTLDPCHSVRCQNEGICVNGRCKCVDGFTGDHCQTSPSIWDGFSGLIAGFATSLKELQPLISLLYSRFVAIIIIAALCCCCGLILCCRGNSNPGVNTQCQNNGVCKNGTCECVNGFTGDRCQTPPDDDDGSLEGSIRSYSDDEDENQLLFED